MFRSINILASLVVACSFAGSGWTPATDDFPADNWPNTNQPDSVAVFMANGIFDPADPDFVPPTAEDFDSVIMGRDAVAAAERRQAAVDHFLERFGVDFNDRVA